MLELVQTQLKTQTNNQLTTKLCHGTLFFPTLMFAKLFCCFAASGKALLAAADARFAIPFSFWRLFLLLRDRQIALVGKRR